VRGTTVVLGKQLMDHALESTDWCQKNASMHSINLNGPFSCRRNVIYGSDLCKSCKTESADTVFSKNF
jgi:hypothetical protein